MIYHHVDVNCEPKAEESYHLFIGKLCMTLINILNLF
jgi:hypothetical protein